MFVHICWVFFRAQDFEKAWSMLDRMVLGPFAENPDLKVHSWRFCLFLIPILIMHLARLKTEWTGRPVAPMWRAVATAAMAFALFAIERADAPDFLYFQF